MSKKKSAPKAKDLKKLAVNPDGSTSAPPKAAFTPAAVAAAAALPPGAVVFPVTIFGATYASYGRQVRSNYYRLPTGGRVFEFQKSTDGGVTWRHERHSHVLPDKYIEPGRLAAGWPFFGSHWYREEILTPAPGKLVRCIDWTAVPAASRPLPSTWPLN